MLTVVVCGLMLSACQPPEPEGRIPEPGTESTETTPESSAEAGGGGGVSIHGGGAGELAPVTGTESLQGGGGGVGSAAKDAAKGAASSVGSGSLDQMGEGE